MIPVGNTIKPYDPNTGISSISGMLGIQQQRQNLQTGQYLQQTAQAGAIEAQQGAKELQAGSRLLADPVGNGLVDEDGNPTKNAYSIIKSVMPTTGDERYQSLIKTAQGHVEFRNAAQNLSQNEQGYVSSRLAGIAADPNAHISDVANGVAALKAQFAGTAEEDSVNRMTKVMQDAIDDAGDKHGMDGVRKVITGFSRGAIGNTGISGSGGLTAPQITTMQAPGGLQAVNTNPLAQGGVGPVGSPMKQGLAPTEKPGYKATVVNVPEDAARFSQISNDNQRAQSMVALSQQVSHLADQVRTGNLSKEWTDRLAVLSQNNPGITARQMLGKYAAQLKTMAESGSSTDAERATVEAGLPNPDTMDPAAVKEAAQYIGGIGGMRQSRNKVASEYVQKNGTNGLRAVDDQFMQHADPFIYTYKSLPAGAERQQFLLKKFGDGTKITDKAGLQQFLDQQNVVKHYGG